MKLLAGAGVFLVLGTVALAKGDTKTAPKPVPMDAQNEILKIELQERTLAAQAMNINQEYAALQAQEAAAQAKALKEMNLDPEKYQIVMDNQSNIVAVPKPQKPEPTPKK